VHHTPVVVHEVPVVVKPAKAEKKEAEPKEAASSKQQRQKLTPAEVESLRIQHGLNYEREHSLEHIIQDVTHPEY
jgi:hypothetical protein